MRILILLRGVLVALIALIGVGLQSAHADIGGITLSSRNQAAFFAKATLVYAGRLVSNAALS